MLARKVADTAEPEAWAFVEALRRAFPKRNGSGRIRKETDREEEGERARERRGRPEPCEGGKPHSGLFTTTETDRVVKSPGQPVLNSRGRRKEEGDGLAKTETAKTRPGRIGRAQMDLFGEAANGGKPARPARPAAHTDAGPQEAGRPAAGPEAGRHRLRVEAGAGGRLPRERRRHRGARAGAGGPPPAPRLPRATAESMAQKQREISVSEFFARTATSSASTTRRRPSSRRSRKRSTTRSTRARRPASSPS